MADIKRTTVTPDESVDLRDRPGFMPCERYGSMTVEPNEVGCIASLVPGTGRWDAAAGVWVQDCVVSERFFLTTER